MQWMQMSFLNICIQDVCVTLTHFSYIFQSCLRCLDAFKMKKQLHLVYVPRSDNLTLNKNICSLYYSSFTKEAKNKNKYPCSNSTFPSRPSEALMPVLFTLRAAERSTGTFNNHPEGSKAANQGRAPGLVPKGSAYPWIFPEVG